MFRLTVFATFTLILHLRILVEGQTVSVNCSNGYDMEIIITGVNDTDRWMTSEWRLNNINDPSCEPTFNDSADTVTYHFNGSTCDPSLHNTTYFYIYFFHISATPTGNMPVRRYDHEYNITCQYSRNGTAVSYFTPLHDLSATTTDTVFLNASLTLSLNYFGGILYGYAIPLGYVIYAELIIINPFLAALDLSLDQCYFSKDPAGNVGKFVFISDSCKDYNANITSRDYDCSLYTNETERFTVLAVRYPGQNIGDTVYVHCDFYVCFADNVTSTCRQRCNNCPSKRKRRDVEEIMDVPSGTKYHVRAGPYSFVDPNIIEEEEERDADNGGPAKKADKEGVSENAIIALAVGGVVATVIVCVTVIVVLQKGIIKFPTSKKAMENPACETGETKIAI